MKTKLLKLAILFAIVITIFALPEICKAATYGDYTYSVSNGKVSITDFSTSVTVAIEIPSEIDGYPVTSIGDYAFNGCSSLTSVTIPDSVTSIGYSAFRYCSSLTSINIPDLVTSISSSAFNGCSSLTSVTIPDSVTSIGDSAFYDCSSLTSVTIPDSVTSIGNSAFYNCSSLTSVTIPNSVTSISGYAFDNTALYNDTSNWNNGVLYISNHLIASTNIYGNYAIIPGTVTIANYAFQDCSSLTSVTIPDSVTSIGDNAFSGCSSLTSVTIPDSVTSIGDNAFSGCSSLTSVTIPDSVTSIGNNAFTNTALYGDPSNWNNGVLYISNHLIASTNIYGNYTIIPGTVTIANYAFQDCSSLISVTIPDSVTSIGDYAFWECYKLKNIYYQGNASQWESIKANMDTYCKEFLNNTNVIFINYITLRIIDIDSQTEVSVKIAPGEKLNYSNLQNKPGYIPALFSDETCETMIKKDEIFFEDSTLYVKYDISQIDNFLYFITDGEVSINGLSDTITGSITIPKTFFGLPVTIIEESAFENCTSITSVTIPDSVTTIKNNAFNGCLNLESVNIPKNIEFIGDYAFNNCCSLQKLLILPKTLKLIGIGAFGGWKSLKEITIPFIGQERTISGIAEATFGYIFGYDGVTYTKQLYAPNSTTNYTIPPTLRKVTVTDETVIPYGAFSNCSFLTDIIIEGTPSIIMENSFGGFYNLFNVTIKDKNVKFTKNNIFENSEFPTLYGYAGSTTESYANTNQIDFITLDDPEGSEYQITGNAQAVEDKIVVYAKTDVSVSGKNLHIALYNNSSKLIDYIIIPSSCDFSEVNVVFKDNSEAKYAKIFLWDSVTSLEPVAKALKVDIVR